MRFVSLVRQKVLTIHSTDPEVLRKGRLIQFLVLLLTFVSMGFLFFAVLNNLLTDPQVLNPFPGVNPGFLLLLVVLGICWWLARNGRIRQSAHLFTAGTSLIFLATFLINPDPTTPYLMLIGIVAIAVLDSVRTSTAYAFVNTFVVVALFMLYEQFGLLDITRYLLITTGVCITVWATAQELTQSMMASQKLNRDIFDKNALLQRNASLLQLSAEVAQLTGQSLDLKELLHNTANLIRDRFGFYIVSIYLFDDDGNLLLNESTANDGNGLTAVSPSATSQIQKVVKTHQPQLKTATSLTNDNNDTKTELTLPLIARGELRGVLDLHSRLDNILTEQDIAIMQIMANQLAVNIDNATLFARSETRFTQTKTLFDLNNHLTKTFDIGEIYRRASVELATHLNADYCQISSWETSGKTLHVQVRYKQENAQGEFISLDQQIDVEAYPLYQQSVEQLHFNQYTIQDDLDEKSKEHLHELNQYHQLDIPLVHAEQAIGLLSLFRGEAERPFTPIEIQMGQAMANQTAVVLQNAILTSNTRGQLAQFRSLLRLSIILSEATTLAEIFKGSRRELLSLVEATGMSIMLKSENEKHLQWIYGYEFGKELDLTNITPLSIDIGFSGHVAKTQQPLFIERTPENIKAYNSFAVGHEEGYWHGFPLIVSNTFIGVLAVESLHHLDDNEIELIQTMVGPLSVAINNLQQFDQLRAALAAQSRQRIQLKTAATVAATATSQQSLDELLQATVDLIKTQFDLYYVGLFLVEKSGHNAILQAGTGQAGKIQLQQNHTLEVGGLSLIGGATSDGTPRIIQDVNLTKEWRKNPYLPNTQSELALPLRVRGRNIGALTVQSEWTNIFDEELVETLLTMADQLAIAIENIQLLEQTRQSAADQQWLHEVSTQLHQSTHVEKIAKIGLESLSKRFGGAPIYLKLGRLNENSNKE